MALPVSRIGRFVLVSVASVLLLMLPWYYLSPYLSAPVIGLAGKFMKLAFFWVEGVERIDTVAVLLTKLTVWAPKGDKFAVAHLVSEVNYRTFGYGVVLLWALLLASRARHLAMKLLVGTVVLLPIQALSLCFQWLRDVLIHAGPDVLEQTGIPRWSLDFFAFAYQFGFLILTPLAPVLLWLILDREFVNRLWLETALAGAIEGGGKASSWGRAE